MKKSLVIICSVLLISTLTVFSYNCDKGPALQSDGIAELPQATEDSVWKHGKELVEQSHYSSADLKAIAAYLNHK